MKIRHPPFESRRIDPSKLPVAESTTSSEFGADVLVGRQDGWFLERNVGRKYAGGEVDTTPWPRTVIQQRKGWYLLPHPLHRSIRRMIDAIAVVMLVTLLYLFLAPGMELVGVPVFGTQSVRLGLLDYPLLGLVVVPVILLPLVLRMALNVTDLRRQRKLMNDDELELTVETKVVDAANEVELSLHGPTATYATHGCLDVGTLPPRRRRILEALERTSSGQPPPGMTTEVLGIDAPRDDGTGLGEDAPMQHHGFPGGMYLRPMRLGASGEWHGLVDGKGVLSPPDGPWPGTVYDDLVRIHWELLVRIEHPTHGSLFHVTPLRMPWPERHLHEISVDVRDGRVEHARTGPAY